MEEKGDIAIIGGRPFPRNIAGPRRALEDRIHRDGFNQVMEAVAYTWFNRFMALRYMEIHGYLEHGFRVLSNPGGGPIPEILEQAAKVELSGLDKSKVIELKLDGTKDSELYRMLLVAQCNALHAAMPFLFERINDETELLLPDNLLHSDSLIRKLVTEIDDEDWREVEIIGWLYQFYISEKKDQVIGKVVKSEDIPAATQLFTPRWIVKYMVQNSLGRMWLNTYPQSSLRQKMEYYIEPAAQTEDVQAQIKAITPATLNPELMTFLDPASGSGHILVEAYDIFKEIYLERGYSSKDFPRLILEKNIYGLDIDDRAAQMSGFALLMKARQDDRRILQNGNAPKLNVMAIQESKDLNAKELAEHLIDKSNTDIKRQDIVDLIELFQHGKTFGSLITVPQLLAEKLPAISEIVKNRQQSDDMFARQSVEVILPFLKQAKILAGKYDCVVTNPPYMGRGYHAPLLKDYLNENYKGYEKDLFSAFMILNIKLTKESGRLGFMSPFVWMFISSYEELRKHFIDHTTITSLVQLEYSGFDGATVPICTFTLGKAHIKNFTGSFIRLSEFRGAEQQGPKTLEAINNKECGWFFIQKADDFKKIPGSPIAYWISEKFRSCFSEKNLSEYAFSDGKNITGDNGKYQRYFWEVNSEKIGMNSRWFFISKGGGYQKWIGTNDITIDWSKEARLHYKRDSVGRLIDERLWGRDGISWGLITSSLPSFRLLNKDTTFSDVGLFFNINMDIMPALALLNSKVAMNILNLMNPTLNFPMDVVLKIPFIKPQMLNVIERNTNSLIEITKKSHSSHEVDWNFSNLDLIEISSENLMTAFSIRTEKIKRINFEAKKLEEENNRLFIVAYGLQDELTPDVPEDQITLARADCEADMKRLISYAIGCMMGRYSLDQPGLVYANSGNIGFDSTKYKSLPADDDGIVPVMDLDWFEDDAACRFEHFLKVAWPSETLEENLKFVADSLSPKSGETPRDTIRRYISTQFFKDHLQTYKKRPIYWLFSSGKQRAFECLVYLHRYNESTLSRMRNEYVTPLQGKLAARADFLANEIEAAATTSARSKLQKQLDTLKKKRVELAAFDDLLRHYADQRIALDLDDGVKVNYGKFGDLLAEVRAITGGSE